ncbi:MAG: hypothetical protein ACRDMV_13475, partial [Streptosporangiales bacterium]
GRPALTSPAEVAAALASYLDLLPVAGVADRSGDQPRGDDTAPLVGGQPRPGAPRRTRQRRWRRPAAVAIPVAVLVLVLAGIAGWRLGAFGPTTGPPAASSPPPASTSPTGTSAAPSTRESSTPAGRHRLSIVAAHDFDPDGDGAEHPDEVDNAYDGTNHTYWATDTYSSADLGNLKPGVGLIFDLGKPRTVGAVELSVNGGGTDLQLRNADPLGRLTGHFITVAKAANIAGTATLHPHRHRTARYWLVWITKLPKTTDGYRAEITDVRFTPGS